MKRPDYRTLQALDAVIRERGFERAAQKLCITQSAVSQRIKQLENMFGQPLLVRTVPPRPTEQGQKLLALLRQVELLEEEWLGDEQTGSTPLLLSLAVNADSLATWLLPALAPVLADSPIRLNLQVEDETRTQERLRRGEVVGAVIFDVTNTEMRREQIAARAREVIDRNLATVQEIACRLGEQMADTELLLRSIADNYADEPAENDAQREKAES